MEEKEEPPTTPVHKPNKEELIASIKEWIKLDNELTKLKHDMKDKNAKKKSLTNTLVNIMKNHSIDCFDISGGSLVYKQIKTKQTLSGKFLMEQLEKIYQDKPETAQEIAKQILDSRNEKIKFQIERKIKS